MRITRGSKCPCGSGLKFKRCCGRTRSREPDLTRAVAIAIDEETGQRFVVTEGTVFNQLQRDAPRIAASFDHLCTEELRPVDRLAAKTLFLLTVGRKDASRKESELRITCSNLLMNALVTLLAAVDLLRDGFMLQPGILIRNLLETLIAVICIFTVRSDWDAFRENRLKPEQRIAIANSFSANFWPLLRPLHRALRTRPPVV